MTIPEEIDGYDWEHAFQCCGEPEGDSSRHNTPKISAAIGTQRVSTAPFQRSDVAEVIASFVTCEEGYPPADVLGVFRLKDGRFAFLNAGCDTTGWDCQSWGHAIVDDDLAHLIQFGLGEDDRVRLRLPRDAAQ